MHAARAVKANREKREEKVKVEPRRNSASSHIGRFSFPRSPAVSIDAKRAHLQANESNNLNFSYIGFMVAVFGAVPLIVGTFVEVPALWEIGLGVTLVGLFIGVVFWCTELCAEAKKFSQKKNQLSTRRKIEDSNLLQVPDRKFHRENGIESSQSSFQSDSVSLITPMAQSFGSPTKDNPQFPSLHSFGSKQSNSEYSQSNDSSATLNNSNQANGHAGGTLPQSKLLLRGTRKDDSRVVSLVQPDPGLEDESDSDAETVIEAPTGKPKIIQVQTCQEKGHQQRRRSSQYDGKGETGVVLSVAGHNHNSEAFHIENEYSIPPSIPLSKHHGTIRMPVMPQEIDKLKKCECGRYLITERDKLTGVRLPGVGGKSGGGSSMPATAYNSPSLTGGGSTIGAGTAPATRKNFVRGNTAGSLIVNNVLEPSSNNSSANDLSGATTAVQLSVNSKIINVNPMDNVDYKPPIQLDDVSKTQIDAFNDATRQTFSTTTRSGFIESSGESIVQVEPTLNSSELLVQGDKTEKEIFREKIRNESKVVSEVIKSYKTNKNGNDSISSNSTEKDKMIVELLEITKDEEKLLEPNVLEFKNLQKNTSEHPINNGNDDGHREEIGSCEETEQQLQRSNSASRPTSLALPLTLNDSSKILQTTTASDSVITDSGTGTTVQLSSSSASSASTVVFIGDQNHNPQQQNNGYENNTKDLKDEKENNEGDTKMTKKLSLDELLDQIEETKGTTEEVC